MTFRRPSGFDATVEELADTIGFDHVKVLHLNDTRSSCGSRVDRHWHIGKGAIGLAGFGNVINCSFFSCLPGIMETPKKAHADDVKNMRALKRLRGKVI